MIELRRPDVGLHREWLDFMDRYSAEPAHIPGASVDADLGALADPGAFAAWVQRLLDAEGGQGVRDGWVAASARWVVRNGEIVGVIALRHELNDHLLHVEGGHIGYAVAPHARRQGVASEALRLALLDAAGMGINPVLVTCDDDNVASAGVIEKAGGVLEDVRDGTRRYWITLPDTPIGYAARPLSTRPLLGRLVALPLASASEVAAMHAAGVAGRLDPARRLAHWADGFPRQDDLDGAPLVDDAPPPGGDDGGDQRPGREWGTRLIVRRADGLVVGTIGFYGPPDPADPAGVVEVGYGLVESARGQGLITDALRLAVPAAECSGATVTAHTAYDNTPSRKALVRAGFHETGECNAEGEPRFVRPRR